MQIENMGYHMQHAGGFVINRPQGTPFYIFILTQSPAFFYVDGKEFLAQKNQLFIYEKNVPQLFYSKGEPFLHDWFHFIVEPEEQPFFDSLRLPLNKLVNMKQPVLLSERMKELSAEFHTAGLYREQIVSRCTQNILLKTAQILALPDQNPCQSPYYETLYRIRCRIYDNPDTQWTVRSLAQIANISDTYFQHLYRDFFGCSCFEDIITSRLERAKAYLTGSNNTVQYIAFLCGYRNETHFMRQFKRENGMTPTQYRQEHRRYEMD